MGWTVRASIEREWVRISVRTAQEEVLLKGRLPRKAVSPRALVDFLQTLARWSGAPVRCVLSAGGWARPLCDARSFEPDLLLGPSPLVVWVFAVHGSRQLVLGDFGEDAAAALDGGEGSEVDTTAGAR